MSLKGRYNHRYQLSIFVIIALLGSAPFFFACQSDPGTRTTQQESTEQSEPEGLSPEEVAAELAADLNVQIPDLIATAIRQQGTINALDWLKQKNSVKHIKFLQLAEQFYTPKAGAFFFVDAAKLNDFGALIFDTLKKAHLHALEDDEVLLRHIEEIQIELVEVKARIDARKGLWLNATEQQAVAKLFLTVEGNARQRKAVVLKKLLTLNIYDSAVPRLAAAAILYAEDISKLSRLEVDLEVSLLDGVLRYAELMKYENLRVLSPQERSRYANDDGQIHPKHFDDIIAKRLEGFWQELLQQDEKKQRVATLEALIPTHEQYAKLQAAAEKYQKFVDSGGWKEIKGDRMYKNGHAPLVILLKNRLKQEGFFAGESTDHYDDALVKAVKKYQEVHQLEMTGEPTRMFWRSLNVSAQMRLDEIKVNIRRWHHTIFEPSDYFIYINIPSFKAQLWRDGKKVREHRVVVGANTRVCNTSKRKWEYINSSPILHAKLDRLVLNPFWNVTPRIEVDEYLPKMKADPNWLKNSDFEYHNPRGGGRILRQKPGPRNALGKVKFVFENKHGVYLHDTPAQGIFNYPVRAFSHGCIRVEKAMKLARNILEADEQWNRYKIKKIYKRKTEHPVFLKRPIDIYIDYFTVDVDDNGDPHFLADVYKIVRDEIAPPTEEQMTCDPATSRVSAFKSGVVDTGP